MDGIQRELAAIRSSLTQYDYEYTLPVNTHNTGRLMFSSIVRFIATVEWDMRGFTLGYIGGDLRTAAGKAAGASSWIHGFFDYGVTGGW